MRLLVTSGMATAPITFLVTQVYAPRGTEVAMVGIRASCQPMPVLMMVAPAASTAFARVTTSASVEPPGIRSSMERRYIRMKSGPTRSRTRRTISTGKRIRFSYEPPQRSVRWLVGAAMNSLIR